MHNLNAKVERRIIHDLLCEQQHRLAIKLHLDRNFDKLEGCLQ